MWIVAMCIKSQARSQQMRDLGRANMDMAFYTIYPFGAGVAILDEFDNKTYL